MGFPLIFAVGAAVAGAAIIAASSSSSKSSGGGYRTDEAEIRRREEQAKREREARERKEKIQGLESQLSKYRSDAQIQVNLVKQALEESELISLSSNGELNESAASRLLTSNNTEPRLTWDGNNRLLKGKTKKSLAALQDCDQSISYAMTNEAKQICNIFEECQESERSLDKANSSLTKALNGLKKYQEKQSA